MVVAGRTREQIRTAIGYILGAVKLVTAAANGSTTTFVTDDLWGDADDYNGKWWLGTGPSNNDGTQARIVDSSVSSNRVTLTVYPAVTSTTTNDTAEVWDTPYDPVAIHNAINQAILDLHGYFYDPEESLALHTGAKSRFDIPTEFDDLSDVFFRTEFDSVQVLPAGQVWNESVDSDFTVTQDTEDLLFGRTSTKFVVAGTVSDGDLVSDSLSSLDLSEYTHLEFPIKVRTAVAASDLIIRLSATANGADTDKLIAVPAISATTDTWVRVAMDEATSSFDPSECTAIISVALEYNANAGANTIWLGETRAIRQDSEVWTRQLDHQWRIDKESRDLVFPYGDPGYYLMKLRGGDYPVLLTADANTSEVPEEYVTYRAAGMLLQRPVRGETSDEARLRISLSNRYLQMADRVRLSMPAPRNRRRTT